LNRPERIGAFLCTCGKTLAGSLKFEDLKDQILSLPGVSFCHIHDALCLENGRAFLQEEMHSSRPDAVMIGGCSPRGHGAVFKRLFREWGLDEEVLEVVDIREGCAWVHADTQEGTPAKAHSLLRIGWAKLAAKEPRQDTTINILKSALVLGGGPAGISVAVSLARQGHRVYLVEKEATVGGRLRNLSSLYPLGDEAAGVLNRLKGEVEASPLITLFLESEIAGVKGYVGNFQVQLRGGEESKTIRAGAIILAVGAQSLVPRELFKYGELKGVMTQDELESGMRQGEDLGGTTVFIQCAGSRTAGRPYCSSICCPVALKNARVIRLRWPNSRVFLLHRDVIAPGIDLERLYHQAMEANVRFLRYSPEHAPSLEGTDRVERVKVIDTLSGRETLLEADRVVLSTPLVANPGNANLAEMLSVPTDDYGFFRDRSVLEPNRLAVPGVYACGTSRWPCSVHEAILQGQSVAASVATLLRQKTALASDFGAMDGVRGWPAFVKESACSGCGNCSQACPSKAIGLQPFDGRKVARVNKVRCTGCGTCAAVCSGGAIQTQTLSDAMATKMIHEAFP
jgi:heterodisulfide reductase subunit A